MQKISIPLCLILAIFSTPAGAVDIARDRTVAVLWAAVAAGRLNVRQTPSMDAPVEFQIPRGAYVAVVEELGQPTKIDGREDTWTLIATETCADQSCTLLRGGWVADSWLAYQERFEKMAQWRAGKIKGNDGERDFTYRIAADASFEFVTAPCRNADSTLCVEYERYEGCREDDFREGDVCVGRGDLYRYRDLVWARGYGYLYLDGSGKLCSIPSGGDTKAGMCDR
ncbi:MAG: SH3 domain-containing protein [Rhodospirillales bacterium]|nr:MAG: SH3 domain-containing protein [Rhodospirillales bacterium]